VHSLAILALCVSAAVTYGILHDQITARLCVEYFTIGHPPVFDTDDPTLLGLGWGVIATWWVGLLLGVPLAAAARIGSRPQRSVRSLIRPVAQLMATCAASALVAGVVGWLMERNGFGALIVYNPDPRLPREKWPAFAAAAVAHSASYLVGFGGGAVVIVRVWRSRRRSGPAG
jgi:hypothetical protein